tara:strand:+ start:6715 stop:7170 length:456 start_codon:yes stop_codon:yes gene_type:complete
MASTVSSSPLFLTVTEKINLNGSEHGSTTKVKIEGINEISKRILTVSTTPGTQIYSGSDNTSVYGTFVTDNVKYIRAKNLDDTNYVILHLEGNSHYSQVKVNPGNVFFLTSVSGSFDNASVVGSFSAENITRIDAMANTAACDIEIVVAST